MRKLKLNGHIIQLLPAAGDEEGNCCPVCNELFNQSDLRRCSLLRCSHIACFKCVIEDCKTRCRQCDQPKMPEKTKKDGQKNGNSIVGKSGPIQSSKQSTNKYLDSKMKWICKDCPFTCVEKSTFGLHMRKEHSAKRPFNCEQCEWCCRTEADLLNHQKNHSKERPFNCPSCEKRFCKRYSVVQHMERCHQDGKVQLIFDSAGSIDSSNCPTCGVQYETSDNRDSFHRKARYAECGHICCLDCINVSREGCAQCDKAKKTAEGKDKEAEMGSSSSEGQPPKKKQKQLPLSSIEKKKSYHHEDDDDETSSFQIRQFRCPICLGTSFSRMYSRERHVERAHQDIVQITCTGKGNCALCGNPFQSAKHGRHRMAIYVKCGHILCLGCSMNEQLNCSQCSVPNLLESQKTKACEETEDGVLPGNSKGSHDQDGRFHCRICDHTFSKPLSFERHLGKMHGVQLVQLSKEEGQNKSNLYCSECQEQFYSTKDHQRAQFSSCGHILCLKCVWKAELGCGRCVLENARKSRSLSTTPSTSASVSPAATSMSRKISTAHKVLTKGSLKGLETTLKINKGKGNQNKTQMTVKRMKETSQFRQQCTTISPNLMPSIPSISPISLSPSHSKLSVKDGVQTSKHSKINTLPLLTASAKAYVPSLSSPKAPIKSPKNGPESREDTVSLVQGENEIFDFSSTEESNVGSVFSSPSSSGSSSSSISLSPRSIKLAAKERKKRSLSLRSRKYQVSGDISEKKIKAPLGRKLTHEKSTKQTIKTKKGLNGYNCKYCGKKFARMKERSIHLQSEHANKRRFQCEFCKWRCVSNNDLQRHILTHTQERPHKCEICSASFSRIFTLQTHYKKIHKIEPPK